MNVIASIKDTLKNRKAKKARRAAMSFNSTSGGGAGKHVHPEPPGTHVTGGGGTGVR